MNGSKNKASGKEVDEIVKKQITGTIFALMIAVTGAITAQAADWELTEDG